jgi:putative ABC transport system ATP-binding protein
MTDTQWTVEIRDLYRIYSEGEPTEVRALDGVNLCIAPGELVTVMGPSGSGKSTLLNMIGALDLPTRGEVYVDGQDLLKLRAKDVFRAHHVGFVFQLHNLIPTLTARENVEIPMIGIKGKRARRKRAEYLLEQTGLGDRMDHLPGQLSGGQRQRVAVARALANNPPLVLADEPTGSLDSAAGLELLGLIRHLNKEEGTTFLIVTHDPAVARQTERIIVMRDGKIEREDMVGTPLEEDLKVWKHSELGRRILTTDSRDLDGVKAAPAVIEAVRDLLSEVG